MVWAGSIYKIHISLFTAPSDNAELLALCEPGLSDHGGHKVKLVEAFCPKQTTEDDGKHVGWIMDGTKKSSALFAAIMEGFGASDVRVISRRKNRSNPFLGKPVPTFHEGPPVPVLVGMFKVFCKERLKKEVMGRLQKLGSEDVLVAGSKLADDEIQEVTAGTSTWSTRTRNVPNSGQQRTKTTESSGDEYALLRQVCESLIPSDRLGLLETPAAIKVQLREHQQKALWWMQSREDGTPLNDVFVKLQRGQGSSPVFVDAISGERHEQLPVQGTGGILADEMGLGKTLTAIAYIMAREKKAKAWAAQPSRAGDHPRSMATLLVVPANLVSHWEVEIRTKTSLADGDLYVHYGPSRTADRAAWATAKIVLTSSSLVSIANARDSPMVFGTYWYRVMIDEAHECRNPNTQLAKKVLCIRAKFRWAITGTPINNYVSDVQPILELIGARPVASRSDFTRLVSQRLQRDPECGSLVLRVLAGTYMLRRKADQEMSRASFTHVRADVTLSPVETELYEDARSRVMREIQDSKSSVSALSRFHDMRKVCAMGRRARPYLQHSSGQDPVSPAAMYRRVVSDGGSSCEACNEVPSLDSACGEEICFILPCAEEHVFCPKCYAKGSSSCPCGNADGKALATRVTRTDLMDIEADTSPWRDEETGEKIRFIRDEVKAYTGSKFVIMAWYVSTVSEIIRMFDAEGVAYRRFDGSVSQTTRLANMKAFKEDETIQVLIGTTQSLGQGHSIEQARRLILVDVEWNPQVSEQAKARVLRLSQQHHATVTQLVTKGTIEEKIWARAERKKVLAEAFSDHWDSTEGPVESDLEVIKSWFKS